MRHKYSDKEKADIVRLYKNGATVDTLHHDYSISKSTIYNWIRDYSEVRTPSGDYVTAKRLYEQEKHIGRITREIQILHNCGCSSSSPLEERIQAIIRMKDQYNLHVLCDTLKVQRSTIYHRLKRSPEKTMLEKENEVLRERIQQIFEDSKGRLGSKKIRHILVQSGFVVSPERVSKLMKEMNLHGAIRIHRRKRPMVDSRIRQNYLQQQFNQVAPNRAWASDITYLNVNQVLYSICIMVSCSIKCERGL